MVRVTLKRNIFNRLDPFRTRFWWARTGPGRSRPNLSHPGLRTPDAGGKHALWGKRGRTRGLFEVPRWIRGSTELQREVSLSRTFLVLVAAARCCLLARCASSAHCPNNCVNRLKHYVLQLGDPYQADPSQALSLLGPILSTPSEPDPSAGPK